MTARYLIGDVREQLATLEDNSVDLVLSSPPFLALRSYLPADHPEKANEIGSEPTPGEFLDTILDVVEACARVLAPHGSLVWEFGDSYSGSGGSGGDYSDGGWRDGQPAFGGSASKGGVSRWSRPDALWLAGVIDTEGCITIRHAKKGEGQAPSFTAAVQIAMMDPQVIDRASEITGVGHLSQQKGGVYHWQVVGQQARYVLLHLWPHLLIKKRQALAAIELQRHVEESTRRGQYARVTPEQIQFREMIREYVSGVNARGEDRGKYVPTWDPPEPKRLSLPEYGGIGWPLPKSLSMIPQSFAWALAYGRNPWTGRETDPWRIRNFCPWVRPNPPVGALGDKFRNATSYLTVATKARDRWFDLDAVRHEHNPNNHRPTPVPGQATPNRRDLGPHGAQDASMKRGFVNDGNPAGAPPLDWFNIPTQPSNGAGTFRRVRVPVDAVDGGTRRTTSPDCPVHGSQDRSGSSAPGGERGVDGQTRTERNGDRPARAHAADSPPTFWTPDLLDSGGDVDAPAATARSKASSRTARTRETSPAGTPSARSSARTGDTPTSPESSAPHSNNPESSISGDDPVGRGTESRTADTGTPPSACTCSHYIEIELPAQDTSDYAGWPLDWFEVPTQAYRGSHYATWPQKLALPFIESMAPRQVCRECGEPRRRITEPGHVDADTGERVDLPGGDIYASDIPREVRGMQPRNGAHARVNSSPTTVGWSDCGHNNWRNGLVLDPFAGSGTTLQVATGCGRDAIGIDIDARNAELAVERVGGLFLTIESEPAA